MSGRDTLLIGSWEVDLTLRTLTRGPEAADLTPKSWDVLGHLVAHAGELVRTSDLLDLYWRGAISDETAVRKAISEIRRVLGDDATSQRVIKTVPKQGYVLLPDHLVRRASQAAQGLPPELPAAAELSTGPAPRRRNLSVAFTLLALVIAAAMWLLTRALDSTPPPPAVKRFNIDIGPSESVLGEDWPQLRAELAMSADGRRFAYTAALNGKASLFVREADRIEALAYEDEVLAPFFSPDGKWIGAYLLTAEDGWHLRRYPVAGGPSIKIAPAFPPTGAVWLEDGSIIHASKDDPANDWARAEGPFEALFRVHEKGGQPERLTTVTTAAGEVLHRRPATLPGEKKILFDVVYLAPEADGAWADRLRTRVALLDLPAGERTTLIENAQGARYAASGHITFLRDGALWAVPFDPDRGTFTGPEALVRTGVAPVNTLFGNVPYAFSDTGSAVILPTLPEYVPQRQLVWVDPNGVEEDTGIPPGQHSRPRVSPDGTRVAFQSGAGENQDIWVHDRSRHGSLIRLTVGPSADSHPLWSPDGRLLYFASDRNGSLMMHRVPADGSGQPTPLSADQSYRLPAAITPDGSVLLFSQADAETGFDIGRFRLDGHTPPEIVLQTPYQEGTITFSPDGRWIVFGSDETGTPQVYVRPYPDLTGGKWQVSTDGGMEPHWSPSGDQIFYRHGRYLMAVEVETGRTFHAAEPRLLFEADYFSDPWWGTRQYDLEYPEGRRFLMLKPLPRETTQLVYIENWFEELKRLAPPSKTFRRDLPW